tara:strand:+ start:3517 stop:6012 length:2496 start_codon:yes stop_codon:yes gene_type:complete
MNDLSVLYIKNEKIRIESSKIFVDWMKKKYLKKFVIVTEISKSDNKVTAEEYIDGEIVPIPNLQKYLALLDLSILRFVNIVEPNDSNSDSEFKFFTTYLTPPSNIEIKFINLLIPKASWFQDMSFSAATNKADCNILISPVDRPNPRRFSVDITEENYSHHLVVNSLAVAAIWRGMDKGDFDDEQLHEGLDIRTSALSDLTPDHEVIICRNFARLLIAPDPVSKLLDSFSTDDGSWILPNQNFEYSNDDYLVIKSLSDELIKNHKNKISYKSLQTSPDDNKQSFFSFFRDRSKRLVSNASLKDLSKLAEEENIKDLQELKSINVDSIATMKRIQSKIITNTAIRGDTKIPELWRDIRSIIFSLIDGSDLDEKYSKLNKNQILNNLTCITTQEGEDLDSLLGDEKIILSTSDSSEAVNDQLDNAEDGKMQVRKGNTLFENLIEYMFDQMQHAFSDFTKALEQIVKTPEDNKKILETSSKQKQYLKYLEIIMVSYFITCVAMLTNYFLIRGNYLSIQFYLPYPNPSFAIVGGLAVIILWSYLIYSLYKLSNLNDSVLNYEKIIDESVRKFVEIDNISNQTALWSKIYGLLIHATFSNLEDENDLANIDLSDVLTSVSAKLGNINQDVFHNIREELVKDGWFFKFYKDIEPAFSEYLKDDKLRIQEIMLKIETENATENDTNSIRYKFYKFLKEGHAKKIIENKIESKFQKSLHLESKTLFTGSEGQSIDEDKFVSDIKNMNTQQDKEFDKRFLLDSNSIKVEPKADEYNIGADSLFAGMPIQKAIVRTDFSSRISTKKLLESFALNAEERIIEDEDISRDDEKDNPDEDKRFN